MKNLYTGLLLFFLALNTTAQVGIGTTTPNATLEIKSSSQIAPANNDGILIPKIDDFPVPNPTALQDGMMIFLTTSVGSNQPGFYYWNNATLSWKGVGTHSGWATTGNSGTNPTTNFIGTTDDNDIIFKRNNVQAGKINFFNTSFGLNSLSTSFGSYNTAIGINSLTSNTGSHNTGVGTKSLFSNTSGWINTAIGGESMYSNTSGFYNTAIGYQSLYSNLTAQGNVAIGYASLKSNTSGSYNVASGYESLYSNSTGYDNSAIGLYSLWKNTTGHSNSANGARALIQNINGIENTAMGSLALGFNTNGNFNTAIGVSTLFNNTTGSENTGIGYSASPAQTNLTNATAIGARAFVNSSNSLVLGSIKLVNGATEDVNVGIGTTNPLDRLHVVGNIRNSALAGVGTRVTVSDANGVMAPINFGSNGQVMTQTATGPAWQIPINTSPWSRSGLGQIYPTTLTDNIGIGTISPNAPLQFSNATVNRKIVLYDTNNNDNQYYGFGVNSGVFRYQTDATVADHAFFAGVNATTSNELMRIKGTGNVGIGTNNPTTKLEVNGFTKLGSNAPAIKVLKLTGTTANAQNGSVTILHGISPDKILSTTVLVEYSTNAYVPPSYNHNSSFEFDFFIAGGNIIIWNSAANSSSILSKPFKIMITYEE